MSTPHYRLGLVGDAGKLDARDHDQRSSGVRDHGRAYRPQDGKGGYSDHTTLSRVYRKGVGAESRITCSKCLAQDISLSQIP